jgi:hypothetical protein
MYFFTRRVGLTVTVPTELALVFATVKALIHYLASIVRECVMCHTIEHNVGNGIHTCHRFTTCLVIYVQCDTC